MPAPHNPELPNLPFEHSASVMSGIPYEQQLLLEAAYVARARETIRKIGELSGINAGLSYEDNYWQGPANNLRLLYTSPNEVRDRSGIHPEFTVDLHVDSTATVEKRDYGFILRGWPKDSVPALFVINYSLAETFEENWHSYSEGPHYANSPVLERPLKDGDNVHAEVRGPLSLLEGIMLRDFTNACVNPALIRARAPAVKYTVPGKRTR